MGVHFYINWGCHLLLTKCHIQVHLPIECEWSLVVCLGYSICFPEISLPESGHCGDLLKQRSPYDGNVGPTVYQSIGWNPLDLDPHALSHASMVSDKHGVHMRGLLILGRRQQDCFRSGVLSEMVLLLGLGLAKYLLGLHRRDRSALALLMVLGAFVCKVSNLAATITLAGVRRHWHVRWSFQSPLLLGVCRLRCSRLRRQGSGSHLRILLPLLQSSQSPLLSLGNCGQLLVALGT